MTLRSVLSESFRNVVRGSTRALPLALVMFALIVVPTQLEMSTAADLSAQAQQFERAGASTFLVSADASVDGAACDRLTTTGIVSASGALRKDPSVSLEVLPAQTLPVFGASPGFLTLAGLTPDSFQHPDTVAVAGSVWDAVRAPGAGTPPGTPQTFPPLTVAGVFSWPADGRAQTLGSAVLAPTPTHGPFDQCWVRATDPTVDPRGLLSSVLAPAADPNTVRVSQLNSTLGQELNAPAKFATRPSANAAWVAGLAALLLAAAAVWARRVQVAAAKEFGMDPLTACVGQCVEALTWWFLGVVLATPALMWGAHVLSPENQGDLIQLALPILAATLAAVVSGTAIATLLIRRQSLTDLLRTR